jgi:hypothetical protein
MTLPQIKIHNLETGEIIEREMTPEEFENATSTAFHYEENLRKQEEDRLKKVNLLDKLGITEEEFKLLIN